MSGINKDEKVRTDTGLPTTQTSGDREGVAKGKGGLVAGAGAAALVVGSDAVAGQGSLMGPPASPGAKRKAPPLSDSAGSTSAAETATSERPGPASWKKVASKRRAGKRAVYEGRSGVVSDGAVSDWSGDMELSDDAGSRSAKSLAIATGSKSVATGSGVTSGAKPPEARKAKWKAAPKKRAPEGASATGRPARPAQRPGAAAAPARPRRCPWRVGRHVPPLPGGARPGKGRGCRGAGPPQSPASWRAERRKWLTSPLSR
ncbi:transcriptional regulatory protein AlgP-like [Venturia canescens]|uniref:transcriptional regulatory protein AlgP-like n=1 Tax=Venturia canescens TaxID=32260 RepID=UPI001C9CE5AD|nr:transcriptional regulatory protein AlgP-like [Venturia canescens]